MELSKGITAISQELNKLNKVVVQFSVNLREFAKTLNDPKLVREIQREINRKKYYRRFKK